MLVVCGLWLSAFTPLTAQKFRRLPLEEYRDKMQGGWIGQMAGVGWGGPTEFKWRGEIIPAESRYTKEEMEKISVGAAEKDGP